MELRKDYILDRWVYLAKGRKDRPREFSHDEAVAQDKTCFFCPGNEAMTPPEIGRVKSREGWSIRWFPNKFAAVAEEGSFDVKTDNTFFTFSDAYGRHEIVVDTPVHGRQLWDLEVADLAALLGVWWRRIQELHNVRGVRYVSVFKNHGREGGASLVHSHSQIATTSIVPPAVLEESSAARSFGSCAYCRIVQVEKSSNRRCFESSGFAAFAPYASRFNYEVWLFPKRHVRLFSDLSQAEAGELAGVLRNVLLRLKSINAPYNIIVHYSPRGDDLHAHLEVLPRLSVWAGFEFTSGAVINTVSPEDAAAFYRG
ncbi:galactose-1-phosphate uridylyltransferase [Candidatus Woesearchaeota archaeon]|nr:galactose-1-phosphate uridylyltransferase [Candidatus Woesearchaeota archaeon]